MKRKCFLIAACMMATIACTSNQNKESSTSSSSSDTSSANAASSNEESNNPKGIGKYEHVQLTHPLDQNMIAEGTKVYDVKCASCHKLTDERLVGPGWKEVTDRRTPEWIMNFVTNTEEMIEKDTAAKNLLEVCLVQMPNQNLSEQDARSVLEFMRKNDGKQ
jgi:cytochrome c2